MSESAPPRAARAVDAVERNVIALLLGLMVLVTFVNVVLRYGFNESLVWGLEVTLVLFAWLVILGVGHGFKVTAHLGVDAVINVVGYRQRRLLGALAALATVIYALLLLKGAWDYWAPFAGFDATAGRWFPTGFANSRDQAWYETEQIPMFDWLRFIEPVFNMGEPYEKMPRFIPYFVLPFGALLILLRVIQASVHVLRGRRQGLIAAHELDEDGG